jgi:hypothetical protein
MIKEITTIRPKQALAPNGHHKKLALTFAWKDLATSSTGSVRKSVVAAQPKK